MICFLLRIGFAALCACYCSLAPTSAWAHAALVESSPVNGAHLDTPPSELQLRFSEIVVPVAMHLLTIAGEVVATSDDLVREGALVRLTPPSPLAAGPYILSYRVSSADGHPVAGSIIFGVGAAPVGVMTDVARRPDLLLSALATANRALHYISLLAGFGGVLFVVSVLRQNDTRLLARLMSGLLVAVGVAVATAGAGTGLNGALLQGMDLPALATIKPWITGAQSSLGTSAALAILGAAALTIGLLLRRSAAGRLCLLAGLALCVASFAVTGHAATAAPRWLSVPTVLLHVVTAAFWIGSLWPLLVILRNEDPDTTARIVRRFSAFAIGGVAALAAAGVILSLLQFGDAKAVSMSDYGRIWLAKVLLACGLLGLATANKLRLTPALVAGRAGAIRRLTRSIIVEMGFAAAILVATASFGLVSPPRTLALAEGRGPHTPPAEAGRGADKYAHFPERSVRVSVRKAGRIAKLAITPAHAGSNTIDIHLSSATGRPLSPVEVVAVLSFRDAGVEAIRRTAHLIQPGMYQLSDVVMPLPGTWMLQIEVLVDDFEKITFESMIPIARSDPPMP